MLEWNDILIRLVLASVLGALIGLERERKNWSAGMRTHMIVCLGSCLIMIVSAFGFYDILGTKDVVLDPSRIAAQVVSGIGFIGAGTIIFQKEGTVRGLTTAAGLWTVAGIGLAVGSGLFLGAVIATSLILIILWALQPLEKKYARRFERHTLFITTTPDSDETISINELIHKDDLGLGFYNFNKNESGCSIEIRLETPDIEKISLLIDQIKKMKTVRDISWTH